eukprot:TRINITY_DN105_c1_g6_i1.p1 TRINITY_DN105_c1_g6~~TRINITY_DN105_c1_g6_i1.p1  ORF type:complete len:805 (+),score=188.29 TRINITY_DN105_c1_g6_i1:820-3234(+)
MEEGMKEVKSIQEGKLFEKLLDHGRVGSTSLAEIITQLPCVDPENRISIRGLQVIKNKPGPQEWFTLLYKRSVSRICATRTLKENDKVRAPNEMLRLTDMHSRYGSAMKPYLGMMGTIVKGIGRERSVRLKVEGKKMLFDHALFPCDLKRVCRYGGCDLRLMEGRKGRENCTSCLATFGASLPLLSCCVGHHFRLCMYCGGHPEVLSLSVGEVVVPGPTWIHTEEGTPATHGTVEVMTDKTLGVRWVDQERSRRLTFLRPLPFCDVVPADLSCAEGDDDPFVDKDSSAREADRSHRKAYRKKHLLVGEYEGIFMSTGEGTAPAGRDHVSRLFFPTRELFDELLALRFLGQEVDLYEGMQQGTDMVGVVTKMHGEQVLWEEVFRHVDSGDKQWYTVEEEYASGSRSCDEEWHVSLRREGMLKGPPRTASADECEQSLLFDWVCDKVMEEAGCNGEVAHVTSSMLVFKVKCFEDALSVWRSMKKAPCSQEITIQLPDGERQSVWVSSKETVGSFRKKVANTMWTDSSTMYTIEALDREDSETELFSAIETDEVSVSLSKRETSFLFLKQLYPTYVNVTISQFTKLLDDYTAHEELITLIVDSYPHLLEEQHPITGFTPLIHCVVHGYLDGVCLLLENGASPNAKAGMSPLIMCTLHGRDLGILNQLLDAGASAEETTSDGRRPLHICAHNGMSDAFELLADRGADPTTRDTDMRTPLVVAAIQERHKLLRAVAGRCVSGMNMRDVYGRTALHYVSVSGDVLTMRALVENGADVHAKDDDGCDPMWFAVEHCNEAAIRYLISQGVDW